MFSYDSSEYFRERTLWKRANTSQRDVSSTFGPSLYRFIGSVGENYSRKRFWMAVTRSDRSVRTKFSRFVSHNVLFMSDNGGRRSSRALTPLWSASSKSRAFRHSLDRSRLLRRHFAVHLETPRDILRRFLHNSVPVRRINGVKISSASPRSRVARTEWSRVRWDSLVVRRTEIYSTWLHAKAHTLRFLMS